MAKFTDKRKRRDYQVSELVTGAIAMFLFKETSRNALNNDRSEHFRNNYFKIFKLRLPHMDTADAFLRLLPPHELEGLKAGLVGCLIEQKVLHRFKLLGSHFTVAVDGTGVTSYDENDAQQSRQHRTHKSGKVTYSHYVVEAKLVTGSGLAISLASEWVANEPGRKYDKQDCEQRAFERLAQKLKKYFPRMPICLLADGLYATKTFFKICKTNDWEFITVLKDECLKLLQEEIKDVENKNRQCITSVDKRNNGKTVTEQSYHWIAEPLSYATHTVHWLSCTEVLNHREGKEKKTATRFVFLTSMAVDKSNVRSIVCAGRNRWKIENEGFNTQKNGGYALTHKYSRSTFSCFKNYYQCLQIAHLINQLAEHSQEIADMLATNKLTTKHVWKDLICLLKMAIIEEKDLEISERFQIRLAG